jgi:hypothetical protein
MSRMCSACAGTSVRWERKKSNSARDVLRKSGPTSALIVANMRFLTGWHTSNWPQFTHEHWSPPTSQHVCWKQSSADTASKQYALAYSTCFSTTSNVTASRSVARGHSASRENIVIFPLERFFRGGISHTDASVFVRFFYDAVNARVKIRQNRRSVRAVAPW